MGTPSSRSYISYNVFTAGSNRRTSHPRCRARQRKRHMLSVYLLEYLWSFFQTDYSFVVLHISGKGQAHTTNGMIDDTIDEEGGTCHEFAHPCRIWSLSDGPLQDVGFSNSFQKLVKVLAVGDETGRIQVPSATVTRRVIIPVSSRVLIPQN